MRVNVAIHSQVYDNIVTYLSLECNLMKLKMDDKNWYKKPRYTSTRFCMVWITYQLQTWVHEINRMHKTSLLIYYSLGTEVT